MNSFWIPALAGQVYAMSGMQTKLHLMSDSPGTYNGATANISGPGYAEMRFKVYSVKEGDFTLWSRDALGSPDALNTESYEKLVPQQELHSEITFKLLTQTLFDDVIMKYMSSEHAEGESH